MPRRTKNAEREALRRGLVRLRYMFRHPQFREDMALLRTKYSKAPSDPGRITREQMEEYEKAEAEAKARAEQQQNSPSHLDLISLFRRKWGLSSFPHEIFNLRSEHEGPNDAQGYEQGLRKYVARVKASGEPLALPA